MQRVLEWELQGQSCSAPVHSGSHESLFLSLDLTIPIYIMGVVTLKSPVTSDTCVTVHSSKSL